MANFLSTSAIRALLNKLVSPDTANSITVGTFASPTVITMTAGPQTGDIGYISGAAGDTNINGVRVLTKVTATTFTLTDFFTGAAINGNAALTGTASYQRICDGKVPGDIVDLAEDAIPKVPGLNGPFEDFNRASESTLQSIFGQ